MTTDSPAGMTHRQVLEALTGLLLGMFVSMIATTVVSTSMPVMGSSVISSRICSGASPGRGTRSEISPMPIPVMPSASNQSSQSAPRCRTR